MNRKTFDLVLLVSLLLHPAVGLLRLDARRWSREHSGALASIGDAVAVAL
jgi:hypothetical protein